MDEIRTCQGCTACCEGWVRIEAKGYEASPGKPCPFATQSGCGDYDNRPVDPCRNFECVWVKQGSLLPEWMKPCESKVILIFDKFHFSNEPIYLAAPVGEFIPPKTLAWVKEFAEKNGHPLVFFDNKMVNDEFIGEVVTHVHGPAHFQKYIRVKIEAGEVDW